MNDETNTTHAAFEGNPALQSVLRTAPSIFRAEDDGILNLLAAFVSAHDGADPKDPLLPRGDLSFGLVREYFAEVARLRDETIRRERKPLDMARFPLDVARVKVYLPVKLIVKDIKIMVSCLCKKGPNVIF